MTGSAKQSILPFRAAMDCFVASLLAMTANRRTNRRERTMSAALRLSSTTRSGPLHLAVVAGLACAFLIGKSLAGDDGCGICRHRAALRVQRATRRGARCRRADHLARASERAGQARHHRPRVLWSRRIHPRASARGLGDRLHHQGRDPLAARAAVRSRHSRSGSRSSSRRARRIWSRPMRATPSPRN